MSRVGGFSSKIYSIPIHRAEKLSLIIQASSFCMLPIQNSNCLSLFDSSEIGIVNRNRSNWCLREIIGSEKKALSADFSIQNGFGTVPYF